VASEPRPFAYRDGRLHCDAADLTELADTHGTPLYVYSADQIRYRFSLFKNAFASRPHTVCYAVKANSSLAILRLLAEHGAGFDIVSGGELERVRRASEAALSRVVFSGVGKQVWEIDAALRAGILLFNVESAAELTLLAARAEALQIRARFAFRVNPDVFAETHPYISTGLSEHKFGVAIGEARELYRIATQYEWLEAAGVSAHIGSQIRAVEPFGAALARLTGLIADLRADGHNIRYVDAGGGLGIEYGQTSFDPAASVRAYADILGKVAGLDGLHLLLEPGRFIVAQAGGLLCRILFTKQNGAKRFVITDAGMNDLIRPALYQAHHEIVPVTEPAGQQENGPEETGQHGKGPEETNRQESVVDIVGPVCESADFFAQNRVMPEVAPGDLLLVLDAGAYGMSLASNYNTRARPAEILVDGAQTTLIRRRESLQEMMAAESIPSL
jgi:diaminopimelate decarboxylase